MVSSKMVKDIYPVMDRLKTILRNTKTVILSQLKLSEAGVKVCTDLKGIVLYDPKIHSLEVRRKTPSPQRMHWSRNPWTVYHLLMNLLRNYCREQTQVVFCTSRTFVENMYDDIIKRCRDNQCGSLKEDDVALVTGDTKCDGWKREFFERPDTADAKEQGDNSNVCDQYMPQYN